MYNVPRVVDSISVWRKLPKHADILGYFDIELKRLNLTTFWSFSPGKEDLIEQIPFALC